MRRIVLITGTRKGIGRKLAEHFLEKGDMVIGCSRKPSSLEHSAYTHFVLDISDEAAVAGMLTSVAKDHGGLDVLINNAGTAAMNHIMLTPGESVRKIVETNFMGTFFLLREAAKLMMRSKRGRIVNFTTVAVPLALEGEAVYAASKSAVETLTRIAARELAEFGITVNAVGPTPVRTDLIKNVPEDKIEALLQRQAIRRFGEFSDIINVIEFFLDERSGFVTGQTIYLGGVIG